jgi:hypothetical protein
LHAYHANATPPRRHAMAMLDMLPTLLNQAMARHSAAA